MPNETPTVRQDTNTPQDLQLASAQSSNPPHDASVATQASPPQNSIPPPGAPSTASTQNSTTSEPKPQRNSGPMDADVDGEDDDDPNSLSQNEKLAIIRAISDAPEQPDLFKQALDKALPFPVDFKTLQGLIHPDKYQDKEEKGQATVAFQKLLMFLDKSGTCMPGEADRHTNFYHGNANRLQEHVEGQLSSSHKRIHQLATQHLRALFSSLARNPRMDPYKAGDLTEDARAAVDQLNSMNATMKAENENKNKDPELGKIRYEDLFGLWRSMFLQPELKASQTTAIIDWCRKFGYPAEWAAFDNTQPSPTDPRHQEASDKSGNSIQLWNATGAKTRTIAIVPRRTTRSINPGYTSSGEKIRMIQHLGLYNARFVVEDTQGRVWLKSSAAAGGQPALDGAKMAGTPSTMQKDEEIFRLRKIVRQGGQYGLNWVAVGEWDSTRKPLPFIVVGFWHQKGQGSLQEAGLSRAALKKILAPREAERLIAESMTSDPDLSLKEALYLICPDAKPLTPLALPSSNMGYPWLPHAMNSAQTLPIQYYPESSPFNFPTQHQFSFPPQVLQAFGQAQQQPFAHVGLQPTGGQAPGSFGAPPQPLFNFPKYPPGMAPQMVKSEEEIRGARGVAIGNGQQWS
ncbi:hypothetical protein N7451_012404 [Penicillium sp. IBT 35674x]|nr:hypothetical protein N7451_012404 [Penicillium sp. IBT 35674x]